MKPSPGTMVYWRFQGLCRAPDEIRNNEWRFGYCTWLNDPELVRMGRYNGDTIGGSIVSINEIQHRPYQR